MSASLIDRLDPGAFAEVAHHVLDRPTYDWIASGSGDAQSLHDNSAGYSRWRLRPSVLVDVATVSTKTSLLGTEVGTPIGVAPMGLQKAIHPDGELAMGDGVARAGGLVIAAVNATVSVADVAKANPGLPFWLQLYNWDDRAALGGVIELAEEAGCKAIVPLVNTPIGVSHTPWHVGFRGVPGGTKFAHFQTSPELTPSNTWEYLEWLAGRTSLPIVPKGIMTGEDAGRAIDAGAKGILVSNHGGRQLSRSLATIDALPDVVAGAAGRAEVYVDGGIRTGTDVLIALALGARAAFVGRQIAWGLALGGGDGVHRVLENMRQTLADDAGLCGIADVTAIPAGVVVRGPA